MKNSTLLTSEVINVAKNKAKDMPIGTFSRLKINDAISDIVISPTASGIWYYNEPNTINKDIFDKIIGYTNY